MKHFLISLFLFSTLSIFASLIVEDTISDVVVYLDKAMVTREATVSLKAGNNELIFDNIPTGYVESSIQLKGFGSARIRDIKRIREFVTEEQNERKKDILNKINVLHEEISALNDEIKLSNSENDVIKSIMQKLTSKSSDEEAELDPDKWIKMVDYYRDRITELNLENRTLKNNVELLWQQKRTLQRQIDELGKNSDNQINQVKVILEAEQANTVTLKLSYLVHGASWYPVYDIRVSSQEETMNLVYKANVVQNTGEDWNNVNLKISTALPHMGAEHPELQPWRLAYYKPPVPKKYKSSNNTLTSEILEDLSVTDISDIIAVQPGVSVVGGEMNLRGGRSNEVTYTIDGMAVSDPVSKPAKLEYFVSELKENITSAVFEIPGKNSVLSDNQEHQVTILIHDYAAEFQYSTIPKLSQFAYLKAKVKNNSGYPLLDGTANIFLDENFVTTTDFGFAAPTEEFWTFLGVDEGISIEHKLVKIFNEDFGFFTKKKKKTYEYEISLKNNKKNMVNIVIKDQIPLSKNDDISVKLIQPDMKDEKKDFTIDDEQTIKWEMKIEAGKEQKIPLKFSVEYPSKFNIEGL